MRTYLPEVHADEFCLYTTLLHSGTQLIEPQCVDDNPFPKGR